MKLSERFRNAYRSFTTKQNLGNSVNGEVIRNLTGESDFSPRRQLYGITYKAIDKIGSSLSIYEPMVTKRNGDIYINHPLITLFNNPNTIQKNPSDFIHLFGMLFEIYGETFWYLARGENSRKIKEVYLLNPAQMELVIEEGELVGYMLNKSDGAKVPLNIDEIVHDKRPNPFNEWRGMSVMEKASTYIDTEITTAVFTLNYMKNNASPSGIVSLPDMDRETFKQFAAQWREGYEGPQNAGKTAFIRGGQADFRAVGATLKDVDQEITRKMAKNDVLMMLEVPKEMLGMTDGGALGRNTVEAFSYVYNKEKIEPIMRRLDRIYEQIATMDSGRAEIIEITHESPVPEDKEYEHMLHKDLVNVVLTVNEVREELGYMPIEGGDDLPTTTGTVPPMESTEDPSLSKQIVLKKSLTKAEILKKLNTDQEAFRSKLVETNDIYAKRVKRDISKFTQSQEDRVIANIDASKKAYEDWLFSVKDESEALATLLTPTIIDLIEAQGQDVSNFITGELLTITPEMRATVEAQIKQIAGVYNTDTIAALEKTITEGQQAGESLVKIKKRVETVYSDAKGYRAERIARTESLRASNRTAEMVYKQNGYATVEWFVNPGACEFCRTYAGRSKTIGTNFTGIGDVITGESGGTMRIEYADIDTPPLHPNCTCSLVPGGRTAGE
jgi:HK97 family phage portal protein